MAVSDSSIQQMLTSQEDMLCVIWIIYSAKVSSKQLGELRTGHTVHKNESYPGKSVVETGNMTTCYDEDTLRDILAYLCSETLYIQEALQQVRERQAVHYAKICIQRNWHPNRKV